MWVCSIAAVYNKMGENEKALEYHNKSLEIKIKVFGQDHPHVADTKVGQLFDFFDPLLMHVFVAG